MRHANQQLKEAEAQLATSEETPDRVQRTAQQGRCKMISKIFAGTEKYQSRVTNRSLFFPFLHSGFDACKHTVKNQVMLCELNCMRYGHLMPSMPTLLEIEELMHCVCIGGGLKM